MMHNITVRYGLKWILWNDLGNEKRNINLGNTENRTGKAYARTFWSIVGQMGQSLLSCLMKREMKICNERQEFLNLNDSNVFGFIYIYIYLHASNC